MNVARKTPDYLLIIADQKKKKWKKAFVKLCPIAIPAVDLF
jgi:hypothetical protein